MVAHMRKCHDCGNVAEHADNITPWVLCTKCGSQDTRTLKLPPIRPTDKEIISKQQKIIDTYHAALVEIRDLHEDQDSQAELAYPDYIQLITRNGVAKIARRALEQHDATKTS